MRTLLGKAGFIHHQDALEIAQRRDNVLAQVIPHDIGIPNVAVKHALDATRVGVAGLLRQLPAVLALHLRDQAAQVVDGMLMGFRTPKVRAEDRRHLVNEGSGVLCHR
jgi:hypothetical protein